MPEGKIIIASNRLPLGFDPETGEVIPSSGGLVTAIRGIHWNKEVLWVGTSPSAAAGNAQGLLQHDVKGIGYVPVAVSEKDYDAYYNGMSNEVIWPLLHYQTDLPDFSREKWDAYKRVNEAFARRIVEVAGKDDLVWVHDFHLFLLPQYLRRLSPSLRIGFFLHVPFPSSEVYRQLPVREEILSAILDADLVGFHDYSYLRHFCTAVQILLGIESSMLSIRAGRRTTRLGVFPVSVDVAKFRETAQSSEVARLVAEHSERRMCPHTVLGVDRLDYTKGLDLKLMAFREALRAFPELRGKATLLQIAIPTRSDVPEYQRLRATVERLVGEINGEFGEPHYVPVQYLYGSVDFPTLIALYRSANVLLVTSKRDGMNLVSLEYLLAQPTEKPGVVLLSEFTGAISTLSGVVPVNPWDVERTGRELGEALLSPAPDRAEKHALMLKYLEGYTATDWAKSFVNDLVTASEHAAEGRRQTVVSFTGTTPPAPILDAIANEDLMIVVDYDGTLVPIYDRPEQALLADDTRRLLKQLGDLPGVDLCVVSGRPRTFLAGQLRDLPAAIAAEHGAAFRPRGSEAWEPLVLSDRSSWYPIAQRIMEDYTARVPRSFVEQKEYGLSWHYRQSPQEFAAYQSRKLWEDLEIGLANFPVRIMGGKRIIEARAVEANKGSFALFYLSRRGFRGSVITLGDDHTDEDLFGALESRGPTIKVGPGESRARFRVPGQSDVVEFLQLIAARRKKR